MNIDNFVRSHYKKSVYGEPYYVLREGETLEEEPGTLNIILQDIDTNEANRLMKTIHYDFIKFLWNNNLNTDFICSKPVRYLEKDKIKHYCDIVVSIVLVKSPLNLLPETKEYSPVMVFNVVPSGIYHDDIKERLFARNSIKFKSFYSMYKELKTTLSTAE